MRGDGREMGRDRWSGVWAGRGKGGPLGKEKKHGLGRGERGHGLEGRRGGSGRFLGLGWFWFSYFSGFPFLSFSNSLKLI